MKAYKDFFSEARSGGRDASGKKIKLRIEPGKDVANKAKDARTTAGLEAAEKKSKDSTPISREVIGDLAKKAKGAAGRAIRPAQIEKAARKKREGNTTGLTPSTPKKASLARKRKAGRTATGADSMIKSTDNKVIAKGDKSLNAKGYNKPGVYNTKTKFNKKYKENKEKKVGSLSTKDKDGSPRALATVKVNKAPLKKKHDTIKTKMTDPNRRAAVKRKKDVEKSRENFSKFTKKATGNTISSSSGKDFSAAGNKLRRMESKNKKHTDNRKAGAAKRKAPDFTGSMTRAAEKEARREKYEKPEVKRRAAQEPVSGEKVRRKAQLLKRVQAKRGQKPQNKVQRYATAYGSERIKKEKDRLKTDPVGAVKGYASRAGKIAKGLIKSTSTDVATSGGESGQNSTQFKRG